MSEIIRAAGPLTIDEMGHMTDDDLFRRRSYLQNMRDRQVNWSPTQRKLEEELCYVYRELEMRKIQRDNHEIYKRKLLEQQHEEDFAAQNFDSISRR